MKCNKICVIAAAKLNQPVYTHLQYHCETFKGALSLTCPEGVLMNHSLDRNINYK